MVFPFGLRLSAFKLRSVTDGLVPARNVVSTGHGTRTVLLDARNGHYWGLDEVGSRIWTLAAAGHGANEIVRHLSEEYDAPLDELRDDVGCFLKRMHSAKLMEAR